MDEQHAKVKMRSSQLKWAHLSQFSLEPVDVCSRGCLRFPRMVHLTPAMYILFVRDCAGRNPVWSSCFEWGERALG